MYFASKLARHNTHTSLQSGRCVFRPQFDEVFCKRPLFFARFASNYCVTVYECQQAIEFLSFLQHIQTGQGRTQPPIHSYLFNSDVLSYENLKFPSDC